MSKDEAAQLLRSELHHILIHKNAKHALISSVMLAVLIPVYMLITKLTNLLGDQSNGMIIYLVVAEAVQLISGVILFFNMRAEETDKLPYFSRIYFYLTTVMVMMAGRLELAATGNYLIYVLLSMYMAAFPLWKDTERRFYIYPAVVCTIITIASATPGLTRFFVVSVIVAISIPLSIYLQGTIVEREYMAIRLKAKTITSEQDPLTKLANRRGLDRKASTLWPYCARTGTPVGIIEIDIDFFKKYNDRFGHPAGDKCIRRVANAIRSAAKRSTDIAARIGGEEFMVFVQGMSEQEMIALAMKIRANVEALKMPHATVSVSKYVTVSMGVATITPSVNNSFDDLYAEVDKVLYTAKENGRNCIVCNGKIYGKMRGGLSMRIPS